MTTPYVDLDAVGQLAAQLQAIYQALESTKYDFGSYAPSLGSDNVSHSLRSFQKGWQDGRKTVMAEIAALVNAIQGAVEDYQQTERQLASASSNAGVTTTTRPRAR